MLFYITYTVVYNTISEYYIIMYINYITTSDFVNCCNSIKTNPSKHKMKTHIKASHINLKVDDLVSMFFNLCILVIQIYYYWIKFSYYTNN